MPSHKTAWTTVVVAVSFLLAGLAGAHMLAFGSLQSTAQDKGAQSTAKTNHGHGINPKNPMMGMVFCNKMQTGELCPTGTFYTLKLPPQAGTKWAADIEQYDQSIEAANKRLLAQTKPLLTASQYSELQQFLAPGLNPLMNELLVKEGRMPAQRP